MELPLILCMMTGLGLIGWLWRPRRRAGTQALPEARQRTPRPGDVVHHGGEDYVVERVSRLEEPGRVATLCELLGREGARWLWLRGGTQDGDDAAWLLAGIAFAGPAGAETVDAGGLRYRLGLKYRAEIISLGPPPIDRGGVGPGEADVLEYRGLGGERLLALQQGDEVRAFAGQAVLAAALDVTPGLSPEGGVR